MKILLVEDDETFRNLVSELLEDSGHNVVMAADKGTACRIIQEQVRTIGLILTDNDLPSPNEGLEIIAFTQEITRFSGDKDIPIILMSGRDKQTEAEIAGVKFLPKDHLFLQNLNPTIEWVESKKALLPA